MSRVSPILIRYGASGEIGFATGGRFSGVRWAQPTTLTTAARIRIRHQDRAGHAKQSIGTSSAGQQGACRLRYSWIQWKRRGALLANSQSDLGEMHVCTRI